MFNAYRAFLVPADQSYGGHSTLTNRLRRGCARRPESSPARQRPEPTAQKNSHGASHHCNLDPFHWQELRPVEIHFFGCLNQGPIQTR